MKIAISLDDVIRAKSKSILKAYNKLNEEFDIDGVKLDNNNFKNILGFSTDKEYHQFLYEDYVFEIFGEAEVTEKMVDKKLNLWHIDLNNNEELTEQIDLMLVTPFECNASIGFTHFFLSKIATRIRETFFPTNSVEIYDKCDVLITADPKLLKNKPINKIVVKIETDYNKEEESDFTYKTLTDFLEDKEIINKLIEIYNRL
jgi:hypothetical protein